MTIQEIETAVKQLTEKEFTQFVQWLEAYRAEMWDRQIEADLEAGLLDQLLAEVDEEYAALPYSG